MSFFKKNVDKSEAFSEKIVYGLYSIYDTQLDVYNPPFFARTDIEACKVVRDDVKSISDGVLRLNADIFTLVKLGVVDLNDGTIIPDCRSIVHLSEYLPKAKDDIVEDVKGE